MIRRIKTKEEAQQLHDLLGERTDIITTPSCETIQFSGYYAFINNKEVAGGFTHYRINDHLHELKHFIVDKRFRRNGIGSLMVEYIKRRLTDKGVGKIILTVRKENKVAQAFFEKCGFEREGFLKDHYRKGGDIYIFGMLLKKPLLQRIKQKLCYIIE